MCSDWSWMYLSRSKTMPRVMGVAYSFQSFSSAGRSRLGRHRVLLLRLFNLDSLDRERKLPGSSRAFLHFRHAKSCTSNRALLYSWEMALVHTTRQGLPEKRKALS